MRLEPFREHEGDGEPFVGRTPFVAQHLDRGRLFRLGIKPNSVFADADTDEPFAGPKFASERPLGFAVCQSCRDDGSTKSVEHGLNSVGEGVGTITGEQQPDGVRTGIVEDQRSGVTGGGEGPQFADDRYLVLEICDLAVVTDVPIEADVRHRTNGEARGPAVLRNRLVEERCDRGLACRPIPMICGIADPGLSRAAMAASM